MMEHYVKEVAQEKEENEFLLPRKGWCVLVTVQTDSAKAFLWGFAISVSLKKNNSLVVLSVRFAELPLTSA